MQADFRLLPSLSLVVESEYPNRTFGFMETAQYRKDLSNPIKLTTRSFWVPFRFQRGLCLFITFGP